MSIESPPRQLASESSTSLALNDLGGTVEKGLEGEEWRGRGEVLSGNRYT